MTAGVIGISRHRIAVDGKGVTTLVALHGCPLRCKYCLNPRCHCDESEVKHLSSKELYDIVKKDQLYFLATGGGITFGGGEPLLHADFILAFKELCHPDWKINIETSLYSNCHEVFKLVPIVDHWIVDVKDMNGRIYKAYTGEYIQFMSTNLLHLRLYNARITARVPHIPGFNTPKDVATSISRLKGHGIEDIEEFNYIIRQQ